MQQPCVGKVSMQVLLVLERERDCRQENNGSTTDPRLCPPFSAGFKIHNLTLTPAQTRLAAGEQLVLNCKAITELNVALEFNWTHSGHALVSAHLL